MNPSFREISRRKKNGLRELTRNLAEFSPRNLAEFSPRKFAFENFCSRSEREKRGFFSWADLYILRIISTEGYSKGAVSVVSKEPKQSAQFALSVLKK